MAEARLAKEALQEVLEVDLLQHLVEELLLLERQALLVKEMQVVLEEHQHLFMLEVAVEVLGLKVAMQHPLKQAMVVMDFTHQSLVHIPHMLVVEDRAPVLLFQPLVELEE